jgi:hypothetical protein
VIEKMYPHPLLFTDEKYVATDHAELQAAREVIRTVFDRVANVANTTKPTLCVGSGRAESIYLSNPNIDHYYHMSEGKDYDRVTSWMLDDISRAVNTRAAKSARIRKSRPDAPETMAFRGAAEVLKVFKETGEYPQGFYADMPTEIVEGKVRDKKYEQLVLKDSFYNLGSSDWYELFSRTDHMISQSSNYMQCKTYSLKAHAHPIEGC